MKTLAFILLLISFSLPDLTDVRKHYVTASESVANSNKFAALMTPVDKSDSKTLIAYKGAAIALKAKFAPTREQKKSNFIDGVALLEYAIESEPTNFETRLIRLSIQENTPKILNYKKNITADKAFIIQNIAYQTTSLQSFARAYIKRSKVFSADEKLSLQ